MLNTSARAGRQNAGNASNRICNVICIDK